jgi:hypothetical protein
MFAHCAADRAVWKERHPENQEATDCYKQASPPAESNSAHQRTDYKERKTDKQ